MVTNIKIDGELIDWYPTGEFCFSCSHDLIKCNNEYRYCINCKTKTKRPIIIKKITFELVNRCKM